MTALPERLDLASMDITESKRQALLELFPEARTEDGMLDFDRLKLALGEAVDVGRERYGMTWPGKADCFKTIQSPSLATLRPRSDESVNFDTAGNLIIEGDNLEVLKLLQRSYVGKVNVIYVDPPYNTGKDFIYPDNFAESLQTYLAYTGQVDIEGRKFGTNSEADGRFHTNWLNMLFPRLYLARNLLSENGVIFASIDDKELHNLRRLMDEIFGEENRVGIISWKNVTDNNPTLITPDNEFILCYAKLREAQPKSWTSKVSASKDILQSEYERLKSLGLPTSDIQSAIREFISDNEESVGFLSRYKFVDDDGVYTGSESVHNPRPGGYDFEVLHPDTKLPMRKPSNGYRFPETTFREMERAGVILYGPDEKRIVKIKKYLQDYEDSLRSVITLDGRLGSYELKRLFPGTETVFTNPKPTELLESLISFSADRNAVVLDFFAGSGSTADAVLRLNARDGGCRTFIAVQLPEPTGRNDYPTIAEVLKERVRRVIKDLAPRGAGLGQLQLASTASPQGNEPLPHPDPGVRVFALAESNFAPWEARGVQDAAALTAQLEMHIDHTRAGRAQSDLLFELLLKSGFPLTARVAELELEGKPVYSVSGGALLICLVPDLSLELIRAMAALKPERVVCLDEGFAGNDQLKTNAVLTFRDAGVTAFKTV